MSAVICALTDSDAADVDAWLFRAEADLAAFALEPPHRIVETSSAVLLQATFKPAVTVVPTSLTLYREHGRVRVEFGGAADRDAEQLERWLVETLELTVAARL